MESPDLPWARDDDAPLPPRALSHPPATTMSFLDRAGIRAGRALVIGCPKSAAHLARLGFQTHLICSSEDMLLAIQGHGIDSHAQDLGQMLLLADSSMDLALVYSSGLMGGELARVMREGALALIPESESGPPLSVLGKVGSLLLVRR